MQSFVTSSQPNASTPGAGSGQPPHMIRADCMRLVRHVSAAVHESCWWSPKKVRYVPQQRVGTASATSSASADASSDVGSHEWVRFWSSQLDTLRATMRVKSRTMSI